MAAFRLVQSMVSEHGSLRSIIKIFRSPLQFAAAGLVWSALNDGVAVAISYFNGMRGKMFALNGVHNQYLVWFHAVIAYIVFPSVWAFFAWTTQAPRQMLRSLKQDGVFSGKIGCTEEDGAVCSGFNQRSWSLLYAVGILLVLVGSYSLWFNPPAHEPGIIYNIRSHVASTVVLWFMLWLILWRIVDAILALDKTFRDRKVYLRPFHRDQVGGFGALERYARVLLFFFGLVFFGLLIDFLQTVLIRREPRDVILLIYIWTFVVLVPVLFLGTLWPSHTAMIRERDRILRTLVSDDWRHTSFGHVGDPASMKRQLDQAAAAQRLQDSIRAFPVWPFRFGHDVLLPLSESFAAAAIAHLVVGVLFRPR